MKHILDIAFITLFVSMVSQTFILLGRMVMKSFSKDGDPFDFAPDWIFVSIIIHGVILIILILLMLFVNIVNI